MVWHGKAGLAGRGWAGLGMARQARLGEARLGVAGQGRQSTNRSDRAGYKWIANNKQK